MKKYNWILFAGIIVALTVLYACKTEYKVIKSGNLVISINNKMQTKIGSAYASLNPVGNKFSASEVIEVFRNEISDFNLETFNESTFYDNIGSGKQYICKGIYKNEKLKIEKTVDIKTYEKFADFAVFNVTYKNLSDDTINVNKWINNKYSIQEQINGPVFWSFQGSSTSARADWILPISNDFYQKNYMGMNNSDYGGGIPVSDVWRPDMGIAVGHTELLPRLVSIPVEIRKPNKCANLWVEYEYKYGLDLAPKEELKTYETFVSVHKGDYFATLENYSAFMQAKGIMFPESQAASFDPVWCAWGYERNFTLDEIVGTLPKVKELGFKWAVLDDGFQIAEGDWNVNTDKFPGGNKQMKNLVSEIHSYGLKAKLWWAPLAVDPCSNLLSENPDIIVFTEEWAPQYITWWNSYYMSPTYFKTLDHTKSVLDLFIDEWGFDGLKLDGQHMNAVGPDHNPKHNLDYPEQSVEKLPDFFKMIYDETIAKKPEAVIENCPCGTCMSFFNMPFMNQAVSSDPTSSWQIRLKGKTYKALIPQTAYYGDHVELSDNGNDFATSFGIGAVLGSKFTWPKDNPSAEGVYLLTPEKEKVWKKWIGLYNKKMLSKEKYLGNLYDIGFDKPEAHVIQKGDTLFYAFYANEWNGDIDLRGLAENGEYVVYDYFNEKELSSVSANKHVINAKFKKDLLIEVYPKK
jgi:alpha-galactosidase